MKKLLAAVLMSALLLNVGTISSFASGTGHHRNPAKTCRNNTYTCIQNDCSFTDADGDGICDNCGTQNCKNACEASFARYGIAVTGDAGMVPPHHVPADSPLVRTLLDCYQVYTGDTDAKPLAIGGGTYVHDIPGGVAFGCAMPGFNGNMHGADEHTCIADQLTAAKIFTQAIIDLCS